MGLYNVGNYVRFTYNGTVREGVVEVVHSNRITVRHNDGCKPATYKSYLFMKITNETVWPYGWHSLAG